MTVFDCFVVVDWSAGNAPATGKDSIWIADLDARGTTTFSNPPTRHDAARELEELVRGDPAQRTLLTVDASLGYPSGSADWFDLDGDPPWQAMWQILERELTDDDHNRSNRFEVAASMNRRGGNPKTGAILGAPCRPRRLRAHRHQTCIVPGRRVPCVRLAAAIDGSPAGEPVAVARRRQRR